MVYVGPRQHGIVLDLGAAKRRAVGRNNDQLGLALDDGFDGGLVAQSALAALHDEGELGVDGLNGLLLLLVSGH